MFRSILPPPLPPLISLGPASAATALVALVIVGAAYSPANGRDRAASGGASERVRYLLPLLPHRGETKTTGLEWSSDLSRLGGNILVGQGKQLAAGMAKAEEGVHVRTRPHPQQPAGTLFPPDTEPTGGSVYIESQLDRPVQRDPTSAAPAYPSYLEHEHIEGSVTVSYIVDTTGLADSASMRVREMTHPAFAEAVRSALSGMHFRPAELDGRRVRQLVLQEFRFVIPPPVASARGPIARGTARPAAVPDSGS